MSTDFVTVTLPEVINGQSASRLAADFDRAAADSGSVLVVMGTGTSFCRGLDIDAACDPSSQFSVVEGVRQFATALGRLLTFPKPTLAIVDGPASGGGVGLAAACDVVVASRQASFALGEGLFGLVPAVIRPALERRLTPQRLNLLVLTGAAQSADEARILGLVDDLVPSGSDLDSARDRWMRALTRASHQSVQALRAWAQPGIEAGLAAGVKETIAGLASPEVKNRLTAFRSGVAPWQK